LEAALLSKPTDLPNGRDTKTLNGQDTKWHKSKEENHIAMNSLTEMSLMISKLLMLIMANMILQMTMVSSIHGKEMEVPDLNNKKELDLTR